MEKYDLIIIGGGSSGLMIADRLNDTKLKVLILEGSKRIGTKLLMTGNGRCNVLSSDSASELEIAIHNGRFLRSAYHKYDLHKFFKQHKLPLKQENRRLYPASERAKDVVEAFKIHNVKLKKSCKVDDLIFKDGRLVGVKTKEGEEFYGKNIAVCAGGKSYPQSGSDGSMHRILKKHGVKLTEIYPSEVALMYPDFVELSGLALQDVRMFNSKKREYSGDLLFTHKGLSGPLSISMGEFVARGENPTYLDFLPKLTEDQIFDKLWNNHKFLEDKFPKRFYQHIMQYFPHANPNKKEIRKFVTNKIKRYELVDIKTFPIQYAFTTAGGVSLKEVSPKTCQHKKIDNLYIAGEILDLHGEIGGYNLMVAWYTGMIVADAIKEKFGIIEE
ncbi:MULTISPECIES: aminoacetone oxidase family FAD-binding enzyme [unclassified Gemella]|uniref:NAD(P)/FAD-dependent oxidoreductase n=1 Tax=unclassified Gemella TaxID=2624949 RepID=UPI001073B756|nr:MULTISPECIES: aminoacetone oxidase family FAD-binding enzyme [unclassified Gemella]MBF0709969.1 aminoacetone oxidase family FAD-binding enzyme [Gemella sp. GL1.1]MBF0747340.1 aminoacetone oxidase family FAD-binding enzyme [Gemella sp. 19428wG2_WT2a]NYS27313.1 aminoacetone oxidase family FAD-binding enzyme [Gemella sp. GL1]TFU57533.1 aminoacetone oxidase family FAD-binding enzyme [Gemella sp. WT2a]